MKQFRLTPSILAMTIALLGAPILPGAAAAGGFHDDGMGCGCVRPCWPFPFPYIQI